MPIMIWIAIIIEVVKAATTGKCGNQPACMCLPLYLASCYKPGMQVTAGRTLECCSYCSC